MKVVNEKNNMYIVTDAGEKHAIYEDDSLSSASYAIKILGSKFICAREINEELLDFNCKDLPQDVMLTTDIRFPQYPACIYVDLSKNSTNNIRMLFAMLYEINSWEEELNIMQFTELLVESVSGISVIDGDTKVESGSLFLNLMLEVSCSGTMKEIIINTLSNIKKEHEKILKYHRSIVKIIRESSIPKEYQPSSVSLLFYFKTIVYQSNPDIDVSLSIDNTDDRIKVTISCNKDDEEFIENLFSKYGLVISGEISPNEILSESHHVIALKHKLEISEMELRQSREYFSSERNQYDLRINSLEENLKNNNNILMKMMVENKNIREDFSKILKFKNNKKSTRKLVKYLIANIEKKNKKKTLKSLEKIKKNDSGIFNDINEIIIKGAISGVSGNILYQWVLPLISSLPK